MNDELRIMGHKRSGQIVVLVLLLSLMGLTIGLSQVSRSLSDLKQVTYVDTGTKAFAGAEAGLQFALNDLTTKIDRGEQILECTAEIPIKDLLALGTNFSSVTYNICPNIKWYVIFPNVPSDEVREIDLAQINSNVTSVDVFWYNSTNSSTALEVIVLDNSNNLLRFAYNPTESNQDTGFKPSLAYSNCSPYPTEVSAGRCAQTITVSRTSDKFLRIKPLAASSGTTNIVVVARGTGTLDLGPATYTITATATTTNQTKKKLQIIKTPPALPGVFDNAFYSGGSITKN